jgi:hypothetical protein
MHKCIGGTDEAINRAIFHRCSAAAAQAPPESEVARLARAATRCAPPWIAQSTGPRWVLRLAGVASRASGRHWSTHLAKVSGERAMTAWLTPLPRDEFGRIRDTTPLPKRSARGGRAGQRITKSRIGWRPSGTTWTVVGPPEDPLRTSTHVTCRCDCGTVKEIGIDALRRRQTRWCWRCREAKR